jgi:hypothetical protein
VMVIERSSGVHGATRWGIAASSGWRAVVVTPS